MKNFILLFSAFLLAGTFVSCSDDDDDDNVLTVSFAQTAYLLPANEPVKIELTASKAVVENTTVKFNASGTATENEDYTISAKEFVFPTGASSAFVEITPTNNFEAEKNISLALLSGSNYSIGKNKICNISVTPKEQLIYSFVSEYYTLANEVNVEMEIKSVSGYKKNQEIHIPFVIDPSSTATEGKHFEIEGNVKEFVIPVGSSKGTVKIKLIGEANETNNRIILNIEEMGKQFIPGDFESTTVKIDGKPMGRMIGKWVFKEERALEYWKTTYTGSVSDSDFKNMPVNNSNADTLQFISGKKDTMKPTVSGDLKNYFRDCEITYLKDDPKERLQEEGGMPPAQVTISIYQLSKANVTFSATTIQERSAQIGFRMIDDNTLEITLYDYEPTDFFQEIYESMKYASDESEIPMRLTPIRYHFTKVN